MLRGGWRTCSRLVLAGFIAAQLLGFASILVARGIGIRTNAPAGPMAIIYLWHLLIAPLTALIALPAVVIGWSYRALRRPAESASPAPTENRLSRRDLLRVAAVSVPPLAAMASTGAALCQLDSLRVRRIDIPLKNLPPALDGLTIAQVSDVHVGRFTRARELPAIAEMTNRLRADLVLLTGDLI